MKYGFIIFSVILGSVFIQCAWADDHGDGSTSIYDALTSLVSESQEVMCARGIFKYIRREYDYDLESEYARIYELDTESQSRMNSAMTSVRMMAGMRGIPVKQSFSTEMKILEMAFVRSDRVSDRALWTQLLVTHPFEDDIDNSEPRLNGDVSPTRISIWKDGTSYYYYAVKEELGQWNAIHAPGGVSLIKAFELFGQNNNYVSLEMLRKAGPWVMRWEVRGGVIECVWTEKRNTNNQRGIEFSKDRPYRVLHAWSKFDGTIAREVFFEDFIQIASGKYYPRISRFRTFAPIEDRVVLAIEESYEVIASEIDLSCKFDPIIFERSYYE